MQCEYMLLKLEAANLDVAFRASMILMVPDFPRGVKIMEIHGNTEGIHLSWFALAGLPLVHLKGAMAQAKGHWSKAPEKVLQRCDLV